MKNKITGLLLFITALIFQRMQTEHFGNNLFPQTILEFLCDLISVIIIYFAFVTFNKGQKLKQLHKLLLYFITIIHLPLTLIRLLISIIIKIDLWCDKVIDSMISDSSE
jgi:hypothetical protein